MLALLAGGALRFRRSSSSEAEIFTEYGDFDLRPTDTNPDCPALDEWQISEEDIPLAEQTLLTLEQDHGTGE